MNRVYLEEVIQICNKSHDARKEDRISRFIYLSLPSVYLVSRSAMMVLFAVAKMDPRSTRANAIILA